MQQDQTKSLLVACFTKRKPRLVEYWQWGLVDLAVVGNEPSLAWQITGRSSPESLASQICSTATSSLAPTANFSSFFLSCQLPPQLGPTIWKLFMSPPFQLLMF